MKVTSAKILTLLLTLLATGSSVSAHATLVLGTFGVRPAQTRAGEPVTLELRLEDPTQVPVEDAYVFAELRPEADAGAEPVRGEFVETDEPGVYTTALTLKNPGRYSLRLRDQTYRQEEASATLESPLRVGGRNPAQSFVFPPTATGPASLRSWLLWLIGLPIVAALVVTVLVLTRGGDKSGDESAKRA